MSDDSNEQGDAVADFAGRVFGSALGGLEILSIYLGDRLGWYRALAESGQLSSTELARRTATQERYAREWLEQQAVSGILTVEGTDAADAANAAPVAASDRRFSLPAAHAEVLADGTSLDYLAPSVRMFAAAAAQLPQLLDVYRAGGGVSWQQLGADAHESQGDMNRPWFEKRLAPALTSVGSLHEVLSRPGAHIADVGCGHGWSTLALARAYPAARVEGFDVDQPSIEAARRHAAEAGLGEHVRFHLVGGEELAAEGRFDAAFVFEAVHDMPHPVEVLAAVRRAVRDDGQVVIMDEAVAERFAPDGDDVERYMYGFSLVVCLPDSLSSPGSVGTGTVMRQSTLEDYSRQAGFSGIEELPIEGFASFRFTRLVR